MGLDLHTKSFSNFAKGKGGPRLQGPFPNSDFFYLKYWKNNG